MARRRRRSSGEDAGPDPYGVRSRDSLRTVRTDRGRQSPTSALALAEGRGSESLCTIVPGACLCLAWARCQQSMLALDDATSSRKEVLAEPERRSLHAGSRPRVRRAGIVQPARSPSSSERDERGGRAATSEPPTSGTEGETSGAEARPGGRVHTGLVKVSAAAGAAMTARAEAAAPVKRELSLPSSRHKPKGVSGWRTPPGGDQQRTRQRSNALRLLGKPRPHKRSTAAKREKGEPEQREGNVRW